MPKEQTIVLTGGGTAGHVMPHLALLSEFHSRQWRVIYIGSNGMEKVLVEKAGIEFHAIATGKLRRYFSMQNFFDIFRILLGILQSFLLLVRFRPKVVFSKGGFVSVPVCIAAKALGIPVITHESDLTPGLATKIIGKVADKVLYAFPETAAYVSKTKGEWVGTPIREELFKGDSERARKLCQFPEKSRPTLLVMGGSLGAANLNQILLNSLPRIVERFNVVHLTGKDKSIEFKHSGYRGFEFLGKELSDVFALSDFVISRSGANAIFEVVSLRRPMLLVPLESGSRGDQLLNAECFVRQGWALLAREAELNSNSLIAFLDKLQSTGPQMIEAQKTYSAGETKNKVMSILGKFF